MEPYDAHPNSGIPTVSIPQPMSTSTGDGMILSPAVMAVPMVQPAPAWASGIIRPGCLPQWLVAQEPNLLRRLLLRQVDVYDCICVLASREALPY